MGSDPKVVTSTGVLKVDSSPHRWLWGQDFKEKITADVIETKLSCIIFEDVTLYTILFESSINMNIASIKKKEKWFAWAKSYNKMIKVLTNNKVLSSLS